jgi:hypothetical protein
VDSSGNSKCIDFAVATNNVATAGGEEYLRDRIIADAIIRKLGFQMTQEILSKKGEPILYARIRRDTIFIWALFHKKNIDEVNKLIKLYSCGSFLSEVVSGEPP